MQCSMACGYNEGFLGNRCYIQLESQCGPSLSSAKEESQIIFKETVGDALMPVRNGPVIASRGDAWR